MYQIRRPPGQNFFCSLSPSFHRTSTHNTQHDCCCFLPMAHGIPLITVNAIVCVLGSNCRLHRASNYLLFSLAIADLIVTLVCTPLLLEIIIEHSSTSTSAQRAWNVRLAFYPMFHVPHQSFIWSQSALIVSLPLCFLCGIKS